MSLRFRLIFSIGLALLASLAFGSALTFWHAAHQVQTEMQAAMAVGEHIVRNAVDDSKQDNRRRHGMERLIAEFDGNRHLQASLIDRGNHVVLASKPEPPDSHVPRWFRRWLDGGSQTVKVLLPSDTEDYGAVLLATDASNELAEAWSDIGLALALLVIFCTLVLGLIYWTLARGLRPLNDLNVAFVRVGRRVGRGGHYIEREIAAELAIAKFSKRDPLDQLTTREVDILRLLGEGKTYAQIASAIGVSYKTVANSSSLIKEKLAVETTADLIRLSIESRRR